jgi:hypothetical protein
VRGVEEWVGRHAFGENLAKKDSLELSSTWVVLAKEEESLGPIEQLSNWKPLPPEAGRQYRWTDDYTNLLSVLRFSHGPEFDE